MSKKERPGGNGYLNDPPKQLAYIASVSDIRVGDVIIYKDSTLTITHILYRRGSLSSFFVLSCRDGERVVKVNVREDGMVEVTG